MALKLKSGLMILLFCGLLPPIKAQETINFRKYLGIGVRASVFQVSELPVNLVPSNRLLINVDPVKYLRIEAHASSYRNTHEQVLSTYPGYTKYSLKEGSTLLGGGIFGLYPVGNVKFIAGARFSQSMYMQDQLSYTYPNASVVTDKGKINIISGVIGGEYNFNKWFSIGAEFSYINVSDVFNPYAQGIPNTKTTTNITESSIIFRFYPL